MTSTRNAPDQLRSRRRRSYLSAVEAIRSKLSEETKTAINSDRWNLSTETPSARSRELASRRGDYTALEPSDFDDIVGFACLLAYAETALACRSFLNRSDTRDGIVIDEDGCTFRQDGSDKRIPRAYFAARVGSYALLPHDLANDLFGALHEALLDGTLKLDDLLCTADRTARKVTVRFN